MCACVFNKHFNDLLQCRELCVPVVKKITVKKNSVKYLSFKENSLFNNSEHKQESMEINCSCFLKFY